MGSPTRPPFPATSQLCADLPLSAHQVPSPYCNVPGYPHVSLRDGRRLLEFLEKEYCSADLDRMAGKLWWMSKQDSASISPLHRQFVKRRSIVVSEDPKLHLVWINDRIFLKPLPRYLLSHTFWRDYLGEDVDRNTRRCPSRVRKAALGYLRTYYYLVLTESDFRIAQDPSLRLIPEGVTWGQFCDFAPHLANIDDQHVSERYRYGEIRLTRLNFYAPLLLGKWHFQRVEYQYGSYFARFYGPILFVIGMVSIILNGLQVVVATFQANSTHVSESLLSIAIWFSVAMIICFSSVLFFLSLLLVYRIMKEWRYAISDRLRHLEEGRLKSAE